MSFRFSLSARLRARISGLLFACPLCLTTAVALGDAVAPGEEGAVEDQVEHLVVTAYRTPVALENVASDISIVEGKTLIERQQSFAVDVLRDLPGVSVGRTSTNGSLTQMRVRGAESNHLLVLIDGVEVNDPAAGDEFNFGSLTSFDIESMELVRGPQSALWGSDAMAGVLNIRTRTGKEPLSGGLFVEGGSFGSLSEGGRLSAASERGTISFHASHYETDGVSAAAAGREKDGYENTTLGLNGRYSITDTFQLGFSSRYTDDTLQFDGTDFDGTAIDADNQTDKEMLLLSADAGLSLFDDRLENVLRVTYLDTDNVSKGDFPSTFGADKTGVYLQSTLNFGARPAADRHRLTFAADYEDENYTQRSSFADQDQSLDNLGLVLEYFSQATEQLSVSASVRYDDNSEFKDVTTWRATGAYNIASWGTRFRATVGTGQKRPGFTERFGFSPDFFIGNPDLKPEQNRGFDLGIDQRFSDGRLVAGLTYFNERLEDEIVLVGFPSTPVNLDRKSRREGVEVTLTAGLADDVALTANYTYTSAKQPTADSGYAREIRRPRHQAAVNLNHLFHGGRGNVNLNLSYTGSQTDQVFSFPVRTVTLKAYTLANVTAEYALTPWLTLFGRAENLFDESQEDVAGFQNPGRGFYGGFRFGR